MLTSVDFQMKTLVLVDVRALDVVRRHLPDEIQAQGVDTAESAGFNLVSDRPVVGGVALTGQGASLRAALSDGPFHDLPIAELDPDQPDAVPVTLFRLLLTGLQGAYQQMGDARSAAALLRGEKIAMETRFREIENLLYTLGSPQVVNALTWPAAGGMLTLAQGQTVAQVLPLNVVSLTAIDLWCPQVLTPQIAQLSVAVEDVSGAIYKMQPAAPELGLETGWLRFVLAAPVDGIGRDCRLVVRWSGEGSIRLALGQPVPDKRFQATILDGSATDETLSLRVWKSVGGVRLPSCTPSTAGARSVSIRSADFLSAGNLPRPQIFASPPASTDHVSAAYWHNEDSILVHPSRSGAACAIIRDVDLAGLSHLSALVTVGHNRAPHMNFAVGVAPHGAVDDDGLWQRRLGTWAVGVPPHGWAEAHCFPVEPITGRADILLATSLATDVPNDLSWGLFRGFRISLGTTREE